MFRALRADEVECRVNMVMESKGEGRASLLLYKDARCDMNILDETVGPMGWQRTHSRDNANCIVSLWDESKGQWVSKEDTGTESNTEAAKGLASDSFKRACFNWGIGRELYTAPVIWVPCKLEQGKNGKPTTKDKFVVKEMVVEDGKIILLTVSNAKSGVDVYGFGSKGEIKAKARQIEDGGLTPSEQEYQDARKRLWAAAMKLATSDGATNPKEAAQTIVNKRFEEINGKPTTEDLNRIAFELETIVG